MSARRWDFGDGAVSRRGTVDHAWSAPGFYEVLLWVSDGSTESTAVLTFLVQAKEPAGSCEADAGTRCLRDSRFAVRVEWRTAAGENGRGTVVPAGTNDSGLFRFFELENWEVLVKIVDGCALNEHVWVYAAATTDLGYSISVTDTVTGVERTYGGEPGRPAPATTDTSAFPEPCRLD